MLIKYLGNEILKTLAPKRIPVDEYMRKINLPAHEKGDKQMRSKEIFGNRESTKCSLVNFNILPFNH